MRIDIPHLIQLQARESLNEWTPRLNNFFRESIIALDQARRGREFHTIGFRGGATDVDVSTGFSSSPGAVFVSQCRVRGTGALVATPIPATWSYVAGEIRIGSIPSLVVGTDYDITLCVMGGE